MSVLESAPDEDRVPVARADFKSDETRSTRLVGSTPTLVRQSRSRRFAGDGPAAGPFPRDLVLVGGGHAQVAVLRSLGMRPVPGLRVTLVTRELLTPYSGMLPGMVAGHYAHTEAHLDLNRLARFAGARLIHAAAEGLDLEASRVLLAGRPPIPFDWLSLDVGSTPDRRALPGAEAHALAVKPVDRFLAAWRDTEPRLLAAQRPRVVVVGAGAGGVELALSLQHRLRTTLAAAGRAATDLTLAVVSATEQPLPGHGDATRQRLLATLERRGIGLLAGRPAVGIEPGAVVLEGGERLACEVAIVVTHAAAPDWLRETGLALDPSGFVRVDATLRSVTDPRVLATGDVASFEDRALPKSGVYAVRQGPALAANLRRLATGRQPRRWRPQRRTLALISTGDARAVASWGPLAVEGAWVWRVKDRIDRRWMRRYQDLPVMEEPADAPMRCGGCGAKVPAAVLSRVLARLPRRPRPEVLVGLDEGDDAAVIALPPGRVLVQSVDHFRALVPDPWLLGRITVVHCLGDLWAMGAEPVCAQALVTLPLLGEAQTESELLALLSGAAAELDAAGAALVGGHTAEGPELAFGLAVDGSADPAEVLRKGGLHPGDALILTKALGTGVVFAADMRAAAPAATVSAALESMLRPGGAAAACLRGHGARACTDITGFGLLGHLLELLRASEVSARLRARALPMLPGVEALLEAGHRSTLAPANEAAAAAAGGPRPGTSLAGVLGDPQTAGGLLAGVPADRATACVAALRQAGYPDAVIIGEVLPIESGSPGVEIEV